MSKTVLVVSSDVPFVEGGHRVIAAELVRALREAGHRAELVRTPSNRFGRVFQGYLASWLTDVEQSGYGEPIDHVISLRVPAYAVRHPRQVAWVIHRMREYYDLWDDFAATLRPPGRLKEGIKRVAIHALDRHFLTEGVKRAFCISNTVRDQLERWGGIPATTLYPPPPARPYRCERPEPFVLAVSRLDRWKRLHLLLEALAGGPRLRAVIAGEGPEREALAARARELGVEGRVRFLGRVDEAELLRLYATAGVVFFAPLREDYGFITAEAFASGRAVVTCHDSGGAAELVRDGVSGLVTLPEPAALARALERLIDDPQLAEKLGEAGAARVAALSWPGTVRRLLLEDE